MAEPQKIGKVERINAEMTFPGGGYEDIYGTIHRTYTVPINVRRNRTTAETIAQMDRLLRMQEAGYGENRDLWYLRAKMRQAMQQNNRWDRDVERNWVYTR